MFPISPKEIMVSHLSRHPARCKKSWTLGVILCPLQLVA